MRDATTARGFTLVEVTIVVAIFALVAVVAIPSISNITRAELRATSSKIAGLVRRTYDDAALSGQTHRLAFDMAGRAIKAEATSETLAFDPESNVLAESAKAKDDLKDYLEAPPEMLAMLQKPEAEDAESSPMSALTAMLGVSSLAKGGMSTDAQAFTAGGAALELPEGVSLLDVWVQGMNEPTHEGVVYLYFFPNGFTQDALVHLTDDGGRVFTVKVSALTGKAEIRGEYLEPPKS